MVQHAIAMLQGWQDGQTLDLAATMRSLTLMIVVDALFQENISQETERFAQAIGVMGEILSQQFVQPWLVWLPESFPLPVLRRKRRAVAELNRIVYGLIAKRRANAAGRTDLLSLLLTAEDEVTGESRLSHKNQIEKTRQNVINYEVNSRRRKIDGMYLCPHPSYSKLNPICGQTQKTDG